jgi:hypothetical protein
MPVDALPTQLRPRFVDERGSLRLVRVDRPGFAYRTIRAQLARTASQARAVIACSSLRTNSAEIWAEAEPLFVQARPGSVVATPLAQAVIEGTAGLTLGAAVSNHADGRGAGAVSSLVEAVPFVHKSFSIQLDAGPTIRIEGSIMLKDPERQLVPHFRRIHESARGCGKLVIDIRKLSQINSSGLGIFIGWVGWIQSEPETARYRLEIHIDPKVLWQRSNLMPLSMIAPDVIEIVNIAAKTS